MHFISSTADLERVLTASEGGEGRLAQGVKQAKQSAVKRGTSRAIMASALDMCSVADTAAWLARSVGAAPACAPHDGIQDIS